MDPPQASVIVQLMHMVEPLKFLDTTLIYRLAGQTDGTTAVQIMKKENNPNSAQLLAGPIM